MDCEQAQLLGLELHLSVGELSPEERHGLEAHLSVCAECRAAVAEAGRTIQMLRSTPWLARALQGEAPDGSAARVESAKPPKVGAVVVEAAQTRFVSRRPIRVFARIGAVAACLALLIGMWFAGSVLRSDGRELADADRSGPAGPSTHAGQIMGTVRIEGETLLSQLPAGEWLTTKDGRRRHVRVWNRHEITVQPGTGLRLEGRSESGCLVSLGSGEIEVSVTRATAEGLFKVHTAQAVLTVRGTVFTVKSTPHQTVLSVDKGVVEMASLSGAVQTVCAGQACASNGTQLCRVDRPAGEIPIDHLVRIAAETGDELAALQKSKWYQERFAPLLLFRDHVRSQGHKVDELELIAISADPWCIQYPKAGHQSATSFVHRKAGLERAARFFGYEARWLAPADAAEAIAAAAQAQAAGALVLSYRSPARVEVPDRLRQTASPEWNHRFLGEAVPTRWAMCVLTRSTPPDEAGREGLWREALADMSCLLRKTVDRDFLVGLAAIQAWGEAPTQFSALSANDPFLRNFRVLAQLGPSRLSLDGTSGAYTSVLTGQNVHFELNRWLEAALALPEPGVVGACEGENRKAAASDGAALLQRAADHARAQLQSVNANRLTN